MTEEDVIAFVQRSISSLWEVELLMLLRAAPEKSWSADSAIAALRASPAVVELAARNLYGSGLVGISESGTLQYTGNQTQHHEAVEAMAVLWTEKPLAVINAIYDRRGRALRDFSNAFRLKD